jgi:hypothetical protein
LLALKKMDHKLKYCGRQNGVAWTMLLKWFKQESGENILVGGAKLLKCKDFMCATGWIDVFKFCHSISCGKMSS